MFDVIIIGGGIAAFTAGIFTSRRGLKVLIIGKDIAGQANYTDTIENYPGVPQVGGFALISSVKEQAESFGAKFLNAEVSKVKVALESFVVTAFGQQYKSLALIFAHGKTPRDLGVPGENELKGKGMSYCANCDAPLYKNKIVAVVGIGDIAADAGLLLAKFAKKVYVLSKTDKFVASSTLNKALFRKQNVEFLPFTSVQQILGETEVMAMQIQDLKTGKTRELALNGIFVELGYVVDSQIVENIVELDEQNQIKVNFDQSTSVPGIFACGDVTNRAYKQAVISAGEAATAALACYDYLMHKQGGVGLSSDWTQIKKIK